MNDLLKQVAEPPKTDYKPAYARHPNDYDLCPKCHRPKRKKNKQCITCRSERPDATKDVFLVEGEPCRHLPLTHGLCAVVDAHMYEMLSQHTWHASKTKIGYYACTWIWSNGVHRRMTLHALLLGKSEGMWRDHRNRDTLDNRISNLRFCTPAQNAWNRGSTHNKSGHKHIWWNPKRQRYVCAIKVNGCQVYLGSFRELDKAIVARDNGVIRCHKEFAVLNIPR